MKKKRLKIQPLYLAGRAIVYLYAMLLTVPFFFVIVTALKTTEERILNPVGLPQSPTLSNFVTAWTEGGLLTAAKNSIIITGGSTILFMLNVILVSYCLNKIRDKKIGVLLYMTYLAALFIPNVGTVTGLVLRRNLGLYNNLFGEIFCSSIGITTAVFIVSGFLRTIPKELEEAAMLDGANDRQTCMRVIVPVIKPALVSMGIIHVTGTWNSALGPMLTLRDEKLFTIPMALLVNFTSEYSVEYTTMFAGVLMTAIPIIIVYVKCQNAFISAMTGSIKG